MGTTEAQTLAERRYPDADPMSGDTYSDSMSVLMKREAFIKGFEEAEHREVDHLRPNTVLESEGQPEYVIFDEWGESMPVDAIQYAADASNAFDIIMEFCDHSEFPSLNVEDRDGFNRWASKNGWPLTVKSGLSVHPGKWVIRKGDDSLMVSDKEPVRVLRREPGVWCCDDHHAVVDVEGGDEAYTHIRIFYSNGVRGAWQDLGEALPLPPAVIRELRGIDHKERP